jgi:putative transposase
VVSDDHEGIKAAVAGELPGVAWQRCVVHFERNVHSSVPASEMSEVAEDLKAVFKVRHEKTARALAEEFVELYSKRFPKAVAVFEAGIGDALTYLHYPGEATTPSCARRTCWSDCSRRSRGGRGWWGCSPTRRARAPWPRR